MKIKALLLALFCTLGGFLGGCSHLFFWPTPYLYDLPELHKIHYENHYLSYIDPKTQQSQILNYWLLTPKKAEIKTKMVQRSFILFFHGNAQNISSHYQQWIWALADVDVMLFDYRGFGQSSGSVDHLGIVHDGQEMLRQARRHYQQGKASGMYHQFVVYGQSLGGNLMLRALEETHPELLADIDLMVLDSTFQSFHQVSKDLLGKMSYPWKGLRPLIPLLIDNELAPKLSTTYPFQVLVIHGERDQIVGHARGEELFQAISAKSKDFWSIKDGTHIDIFMRKDGHYREKFLQLLRDASKK